MGFKITHLLLPSRLLVWPLWHTSAWRLHVPPDRMSGTSDTTKWPQCLHFHFVLVVFLISRRIVFLTFSLVSRWMSFPHLFLCFKVAALNQRKTNKAHSPPPSSSVCLHPELLFILMLPERLLIPISVWMSLHLRPPRLSFSRCILFIILLNWFHSVQAYAFSGLIALLDSCKEILLRHVEIENCAVRRLCAF